MPMACRGLLTLQYSWSAVTLFGLKRTTGNHTIYSVCVALFYFQAPASRHGSGQAATAAKATAAAPQPGPCPGSQTRGRGHGEGECSSSSLCPTLGSSVTSLKQSIDLVLPAMVPAFGAFPQGYSLPN